MENNNNNNNNNKNEKKNCAKPFLGYCPNYIVRRICIAILKLYCKKQERRLWDCIAIHYVVLQIRKLGGLKLGCNTLECITIEAAGLAKRLYCNAV